MGLPILMHTAARIPARPGLTRQARRCERHAFQGRDAVLEPRTEETEFCALPRRAASQEVEWSGGVGRGIRLKYKFEIVLVFGASQLPKSQASLTDAHLKPWQGF